MSGNGNLNMGWCLVTLAAVVLHAAGYAAHAQQRDGEPLTPRLTAALADTPMSIDGRLADAVWERGVMTYGFVQVDDDGAPADAPPQADTRVRLLYDRYHLYVGFTAHEPEMDALRATVDERDGNVREDDSVGLALLIEYEGQESRLVQIWVSSDNIVQDSDSAQGGTDWQIEGLQTAVYHRDRAWDVEIAIPYDGLGIDSPRREESWRVNFMRERHGRDGQHREQSAWFHGIGDEIDSPERFGEVRFGHDLIVYVWSPEPFVGEDEIIVYNDSHSRFHLEAEVLSATGDRSLGSSQIHIGPGHRRQHFAMPEMERPDDLDLHYLIVRKADSAGHEDALLISRRPYHQDGE
jgi:hypothetical protein